MVERSFSPVAAELLAYGRELESQGAAQVGGAFTSLPEANALLECSANAYLLGVLFTQGIPAERAWAGPYYLRERLGTLDLAYLAEHPDEVRAAVQMPPMLHRFKETLPGWIVSAAEKLLAEYHGDAVNIWPDGTDTLEVTRRLAEFRGVGRKKAVMGTEILARHFGVRLAGRSGGQVAYDVQVRRVFLRAGLVEVDSRDAVEAAAAAICPGSPGTVDLPGWLIGRETCRPRAPLCDVCRLGRVCPRLIERNVEGVGVRGGVRT